MVVCSTGLGCQDTFTESILATASSNQITILIQGIDGFTSPERLMIPFTGIDGDVINKLQVPEHLYIST
jgi:hypothetical protein